MSNRNITPQRTVKNGIGLGLMLALFVGVFALIFYPSLAPAANMTDLESAVFGTPVAVEPEATIEPEDNCPSQVANHEELDPATIETELQDLGTPVPVIEETPPSACEFSPDPLESPAPTFDLPPAMVSVEQPESVAPATPSPASDPGIEGESPDPFVAGLPVSTTGDLPSVDPFEGGLPDVETVETLVSDPMVDGIPTTPETVLTGDPSLDGIPEAEATEPAILDPMFTGSGITSSVDVIVTGVSVEGEITPGEKISYRFQIINPGSVDVVIDLTATVNLPGWSAIVAKPGSIEPMDEPQFLAAGGEIEVLVIVTAPLEASIGDRVRTSLTATIQSSA